MTAQQGSMGYLVLDLNSDAVTTLLGSFCLIYTKSVKVHAVQVKAGVRVSTILADGLLETFNLSKDGDFLITNPNGERYLISKEAMASNYRPTRRRNVYQAVGKIRAVINPAGVAIRVLAPWGSEQFGDASCVIAAPYDPHNPTRISTSRYLITASELAQTYTL